MNLLLQTDATQYILMGVLLVVIVLFFVYSYFRNKKEQEKVKAMSESLKKGDEVVTSAGIMGKIVDLGTKDGVKTVTIETGTKDNKGYLTFDSQAIYMVVEKEQKNKPVEKAEPKEEKPVEVAEPKTEKAPAKKNTKKTTKK